MTLVGKKAPRFTAPAIVNGDEIIENFSLDQYLGKHILLFFYPMDFTFVCPTEIIAFQHRLHDFERRGCVVLGCSVDSKHSHWAWLNTPQDKGGIQGVRYPLIADFDKTISANYGVLGGQYSMDDDGHLEYEGTPFAYRGTFLIDQKGIVRHELINDAPIGRSVDEALRTLDALKHYELRGEVCPANWQEGEEAMTESHDSVSDYLGKRA